MRGAISVVRFYAVSIKPVFLKPGLRNRCSAVNGCCQLDSKLENCSGVHHYIVLSRNDRRRNAQVSISGFLKKKNIVYILFI